jgi:hypothetical protein
MKVEFYRPAPAPDEQPDAKPDPPAPVGSATWTDGTIEVQAEDPELRAALERAFRRTPVVTDDPAYRRQGTHGEVQIQPGDLEWFRAAAQVRGQAEAGVVARLVPGVVRGGYDPAAGYRSFERTVERLESGARPTGGT